MVIFDHFLGTRYQDFFKVPLLGHGVASGGFLRSSFCHCKAFFVITLSFLSLFVIVCQYFPKWVPSKEGQTARIPNGLGPQPISRTQEKQRREQTLTADIMKLGASAVTCFWDLLHGPAFRSAAWTCFVDSLHGPALWTHCMDPLHGPAA